MMNTDVIAILLLASLILNVIQFFQVKKAQEQAKYSDSQYVKLLMRIEKFREIINQ